MDATSLDAQLLAVMKKIKRGNLCTTTRVPNQSQAAKLLKRGADPNQSLEKMGPLLAIAIHKTECEEEMKLTETFLKCGANPNAEAKGFELRSGDRKLILDKPIHVAVGTLRPWVAQAILPVLTGAGADLNAPTAEGWTVLDLAFHQVWGWEHEFDRHCLNRDNSYLVDFRLA